MLGLAWLRRAAGRLVCAGCRADLRRAVAERDAAAALAAARYDDLMAEFGRAHRRAERLQGDLAALREDAIAIEGSGDESLKEKAAHIRALIHDIRNHL